jgi:hypothetical protein
MTPQTLIDVPSANAEVRDALKREATRQAMDLCGARNANSFLLAVEFWQDAVAEIERKGRCLQCSRALVSETVCVNCGADNQ